ncbi:MAG: response regulator, partial [Candidatus Obscuribacterales bacterium]|nr:response regulator [Candidatus Obscuribacterales bacterium]
MPRKVLLLETDEQLRALVVPLLEARDFLVDQETSGHKALEFIKESKPDLVMVGEELTDIDGIGFIIKLRQKERELKVVFLSQTWRDAEFFQKVTKELKVAHIFHRPIKSSVFGVQVDALWHDQRRGLPALPGAPMEALPAPMGMVPTPLDSGAPAVVPGSGYTPWPAPGVASSYNFPGLASVEPGAAPPLPVAAMPVPGGPAVTASAFADATLLSFRQKFSKSLPTRVKQIEQIIEQVLRDKPDPNLLIEGRRLSHNLKGTSRSCGFDNLGNMAERIEYSLRDMLEVAEVNHQQEWGHVDSALLAAKKEVERVKLQFSDYVPTAEELANLNPDAAKAKVLLVSKDGVPQIGGNGELKPAHHGQGIPLEIISADTATEALERAARQQLDAALIEIPPDGRDGAFQLARELRSMVGYETLPLGFISPNDEADRAEAAHAGASLFLEKPYNRDTLQQALQHLITIREGGRSRVLIVDDDEDFTDLITSTLGNEGMLVK